MHALSLYHQQSTQYPNCDYLVFGVGMILSALLAIRLPETRNKAMPESVTDLYELAGQAQPSHGQTEVIARRLSQEKVKLLENQIMANDSEDDLYEKS